MSPSTTRHLASVFAENLKLAQVEKNVTNHELAEGLGVTLRLVQKWRSGQIKPSEPNQIALADLLELPVASFYEEDRKVA